MFFLTILHCFRSVFSPSLLRFCLETVLSSVHCTKPLRLGGVGKLKLTLGSHSCPSFDGSSMQIPGH